MREIPLYQPAPSRLQFQWRQEPVRRGRVLRAERLWRWYTRRELIDSAYWRRVTAAKVQP